MTPPRVPQGQLDLCVIDVLAVLIARHGDDLFDKRGKDQRMGLRHRFGQGNRYRGINTGRELVFSASELLRVRRGKGNLHEGGYRDVPYVNGTKPDADENISETRVERVPLEIRLLVGERQFEPEQRD